MYLNAYFFSSIKHGWTRLTLNFTIEMLTFSHLLAYAVRPHKFPDMTQRKYHHLLPCDSSLTVEQGIDSAVLMQRSLLVSSTYICTFQSCDKMFHLMLIGNMLLCLSVN